MTDNPSYYPPRIERQSEEPIRSVFQTLRACPKCGIQFYPPKTPGRRIAEYCSHACEVAAGLRAPERFYKNQERAGVALPPAPVLPPAPSPSTGLPPSTPPATRVSVSGDPHSYGVRITQSARARPEDLPPQSYPPPPPPSRPARPVSVIARHLRPKPFSRKRTPFAGNLIALRTRQGWSQTNLARKSGVSLRAIQQYELGRSDPGAMRLSKLAQALDVSMDRLWGITE